MARQLIGFRIRERRRQLGRTQAGLAKSVGISASYLNLIEANKRPIAGALLRRIAYALELDPDTLSGNTERRLTDDLVEIAGDPLLRDLTLDEAGATALVGHAPAWARAVITLYRAYLDRSHTVTALADRLNQDPFLSDAVHQMLTHVTSIRSAAEILEEVVDLPPDQQRRFQTIIGGESTRLSDVAQALVTFFDRADTPTRSTTPAEEVDDFIIERGNYFPDLEDSAASLDQAVRRRGGTLEGALIEHLAARHGITVTSQSPLADDGTPFRNQCAFREDQRRFVFLDNATASTRQFQLARLAAELELEEALTREIDDRRLMTEAARTQAYRALASYVASAIIFPYDHFHGHALAARYDIEILRQRYGASVEQVCHRLVTLRKPEREGIPFAFLRANPAGHGTKRFPLPGLPLARHGHACPLWAIYGAFQTPGRVVRQLAQFPGGARYLFVARTVAKQTATFHEPPFLYAVMIACDIMHADKTVYADGLDLAAPETATPVGPACRLCPRPRCAHREEAPIVPA